MYSGRPEGDQNDYGSDCSVDLPDRSGTLRRDRDPIPSHYLRPDLDDSVNSEDSDSSNPDSSVDASSSDSDTSSSDSDASSSDGETYESESVMRAETRSKLVSPMSLAMGSGELGGSPQTKMILTRDQNETVCKSLQAYREWFCTLDYSPTGAGKTVMTIAIAKHLGLPLLVICPPNAVANWQRETEKYNARLIDILSYSLFSASSSRVATKVQETLSQYFHVREGEGGKTVIHPTEGLMEVIDRGILLICDEVHAAKTKSTSVAAYSKCLVRSIVYRCQSVKTCPSRVRLLSATPCDKPFMVRNVLALMGLQVDSTRAVRGGRGGSEEADQQVTETWKHVKNMFAMSSAPVSNQSKLQANIRILTDYRSNVRDKIQSGMIVAVVAVRMIQELAAVDPYAKFLFVSFNRKPLEYVRDRLGTLNPVMIHGSTSHKRRNEYVARFQQPDTDCRLFIGQLTSIAESINLHDCEVAPAHPGRRFRRWMFLCVSDNYTKSAQVFGRTARFGSRSVPINVLLNVSLHTSKVLDRSTQKAKVVGDVASTANVPTKFWDIRLKTISDLDFSGLERGALEHFGLEDPVPGVERV